MARYRKNLPQMSNKMFLTDGGMETTFVFLDGIDLPHFAAFDLMKEKRGVAHIRSYYEPYIETAKRSALGFVLETATWRANPDWGAKIGYSMGELADINRRCVEELVELRNKHETPDTPLVISGAIGPRGDGYTVESAMNVKEAADYHGFQIAVFRNTAADMVSAFTLNYVEEAIGITRAAKAADIPAVISFTLETDGNLPTGQTLQDAIEQVDRETRNAPAYYMINCAHPTHFRNVLSDEAWAKRIRGIRANASTRSHAELDEAKDLDAGNPIELAQQYRDIRRVLGHINIVGGCCGTDHRHVEQISHACLSKAA